METQLRLIAAISIFLLMVLWEYLSPRRQQPANRKQRWPVNLGLAVFNIAFMRITLGGAAFLTAVYSAENGLGLLNMAELPTEFGFILTLLALDLAIYGQHIISHKWPVLWRLHQVHHTDIAFDATTAVRFHPLEILISMVYKICCIILLGADPSAVIVFEIILNGAATFNHSNINVPVALDKKLRWLIITPDMHRIHHSTTRVETDSNYGFSISCWDRLFKTYTAEPKQEQTVMPIGLKSFRTMTELGLIPLLKLPFQKLRIH